MENRTAIVFGGTGLVGRYLVEELIRSMRYSTIKVFTRRPLEIEHIKVIEKIVDIENVELYKTDIRGDDLFISLGTTMRRAKSIKRYEELDRIMPANIAKAALKNGVQRVAVVSSLGANSKSRNYYARIKGEMENEILKLGFGREVIVRPSMLLGERREFRIAEFLAKPLIQLFGIIMVGKLKIYKGVHGRVVARAMIYLLGIMEDRKIYLTDELPGFSDQPAS
jgi:uncharacterized protein YbjT (DUF2867 family)